MKADPTSNNFFDVATNSLNLSKSVHIGITGQGHKKFAEPAEMKLIVK